MSFQEHLSKTINDPYSANSHTTTLTMSWQRFKASPFVLSPQVLVHPATCGHQHFNSHKSMTRSAQVKLIQGFHWISMLTDNMKTTNQSTSLVIVQRRECFNKQTMWLQFLVPSFIEIYHDKTCYPH